MNFFNKLKKGYERARDDTSFLLGLISDKYFPEINITQLNRVYATEFSTEEGPLFTTGYILYDLLNPDLSREARNLRVKIIGSLEKKQLESRVSSQVE